MRTARIVMVLLVLYSVVSVFGQANDILFFRISNQSSDVVITGFNPVAGTLTCSNKVAGVTNQIQRTYDLAGTNNWVDFVQVVSDSSVVTETIIDLDPPEDMVFIPGGVFQMGDSFGEGQSDELPVHSVYISGFYMGKYEVTKDLWDQVYNWATNHSYSFDHAGFSKASSHPVDKMSWHDVVKWCNARSEMEARTPCYNLNDWSCDWNANGYRLPTEAEWEKAARGGLNGRRFEWGDLITHSNANYYSTSNYVFDVSLSRGFHPVYNDATEPYTSPVGSFAPNGYGLYDMTGNIGEMCWDWYDDAYYGTSPLSNPRGGVSGSASNYVIRGTSWHFIAPTGRSANRLWRNPSVAYDYLGFRVCLSAD